MQVLHTTRITRATTEGARREWNETETEWTERECDRTRMTMDQRETWCTTIHTTTNIRPPYTTTDRAITPPPEKNMTETMTTETEETILTTLIWHIITDPVDKGEVGRGKEDQKRDTDVAVAETNMDPQEELWTPYSTKRSHKCGTIASKYLQWFECDQRLWRMKSLLQLPSNI